jgi:hypothetical protein
MTGYEIVYEAMSYVTLLRMRELSPAPTFFSIGATAPISALAYLHETLRVTWLF